MATRAPLVIVTGAQREIPSTDFLSTPWVGSSEFGDELSVGEGNCSRRLITSQSASTTTGIFCISCFTARKTETTTQVRLGSGSPAAGATPTLCQVGLYTLDSSDNGTLVASTANDTSLFAGVGTYYTRSWVAPYQKIAGQRYAIGLLIVTAFTPPSLVGALAPAVVVGIEWGMTPRITGRITGQSSLPSSFLGSSLANSSTFHYAAILP
jgi:hypothetical protein